MQFILGKRALNGVQHPPSSSTSPGRAKQLCEGKNFSSGGGQRQVAGTLSLPGAFFFPLQTHWGNVTKTYSFLVALIPSSIMNIDSSVSELLLPSLQETVR